MQKIHIQFADEGFAVMDVQTAVIPKRAQHRRFHVLPGANFGQPGEIVRRHGQHHALLRFAQPDFPRP